MSICYYFHPDGYITAGRQVMGRHVAGESFLRGSLTFGSKSDLWIQVEKKKHISIFKSISNSCGRYEDIHAITRPKLHKLRTPGCLFLPGPSIGEWAGHRSSFGDTSWSLCGITHTTASLRAMDAIKSLLIDPVQPWDALICTSRSVHNNVLRILYAEADYLKHRLGTAKITLPQLPIIPLGVHSSDFQRSKSSIQKARSRLHIQSHELVVLFVGRLAFHGKAHPLVMYQALERAAVETGQSVVLVECGWHASDQIKSAFNSAASEVCPSVRHIHLDGRDQEQLRTGWQCADIFCSLSDNIQETFGITPIEAMSAGLPVVVSDWDGYRDTVRDGIDGFRVPTQMPPPGYGDELALRHSLGIDSYDMYCAHSSSLVVVDLESTTKAFVKLFSASELRIRMGENAQQRAVSCFDWRTIIPRYESLWSELHSRRIAEVSSKPYVMSSRLDPFYGFASYPTKKISPETLFRLAYPDSDSAISNLYRFMKLEMVNYVADRMSPRNYLEAVLVNLHLSPSTAKKLVTLIAKSPLERHKLFLSIVWLAKLGLIVAEDI